MRNWFGMKAGKLRNCMIFKRIEFVLIIVFLSAVARSGTIQVSSGHTIQSGINAAANGDTVLVHPGRYSENINFNGKNIVVASFFLTTQDTSYISRTIIDGNQAGSAVRFENKESAAAALIGFTITNGKASSGGGILCTWYAAPRLEYLRITHNKANSGGGIFCWLARPHLEQVVIENNALSGTDGNGGGLYLSNNSNPTLFKVQILNNENGGVYIWDGTAHFKQVVIARNNGHGLYLRACSPVLEKVTIAYNSAPERDGGGAIFNESSFPVIKNSILWHNTPYEITIWPEGAVNASYSDIAGGWPGTGNINADPQFVNPEYNNFHLRKTSPGIDTGDPADPPDPDGSAADMGAYDFDKNATQLFADFYADTCWGYLPLTVTFTDSSYIYRTEIESWAWDFDNDGSIDSYEPHPLWRYDFPGVYAVSLTVSDGNLTNKLLKTFYINVRKKGPLYISTHGSDKTGQGTAHFPFASIQKGIDLVFEGDTILVLPGTYKENIKFFKKKNMVVGSKFLTTGDTAYIAQTIIDGGRRGNVVAFLGQIDSTTRLSGFTLTHGNGFINDSPNGGAIYCTYSDPILDHLLITENSSYYGGGMYFEHSEPIIKNSRITNNSASNGGALSMDNSNPILQNVLIDNNTATETMVAGSAIEGHTSAPRLLNVTLTKNRTFGSGGVISCSGTVIENSVIWDNEPSNILWYPNHISFSDVQDGYAGSGNIMHEPLFNNPQKNDFSLSPNSPCIDTGDPKSALDPDGTAADMGAFYFEHDSNIVRILADFKADITQGYVPLSVNFSDSSKVYFTTVASWKWDFDNDGIPDSFKRNPAWVFENPGLYTVSLTVSDGSVSDSLRKRQYIYARKKGMIYVSAKGSDETGAGFAESPLATIQKAIHLAQESDTVLVLPGTYKETVRFKGKNIVVTSNFILSQDSTVIPKTVIDGNKNGGVVLFEEGESASAVLNGFTVTNGSEGGIICRNKARPTLMNLIVSGNSAEYNGGGIDLSSASSPIIKNVKITDNRTQASGGGIHLIGGASPYLERVVISGNRAMQEGGGVLVGDGAKPCFVHTTVSRNHSSADGDGVFCLDYASDPLFLNSIIWGNAGQEIGLMMDGVINLAYCDVKGGKSGVKIEDTGTINWLDGNIDETPLFIDAKISDYRLRKGSACIDAATAFFVWHNDTLLNATAEDYLSAAPDMGAFEGGVLTDIKQEPALKGEKFYLYPNEPNPFNGITVIHYDLPRTANVMLKIFNMLGQEVRTLFNGKQSSGKKSLRWNAKNNAGQEIGSGIYICKLQAEGYTAARKLLLLK